MIIRDLPSDEKIAENGFYRLPMERHHNQPCEGVSVTSSILRTMELRTPADVWAFHSLNPKAFKRPDTDAFRLGRAMAALVEGGEDYLRKAFNVLPASKPRRPTPAQIKAFEEDRASDTAIESIEFWAAVDTEQQFSGRDPLDEGEIETLLAMGEALTRDPAVVMALGGEPEVTMAVYDEETNLWMLARPDQTSFDGMLSDYKKVNTQGRAFDYRICDRRITDHGYDMQMAFGATCFQALTGEMPTAGLVFQWDQPPYHAIIREICEEDIGLGAYRNLRAMRRFRECLDSGDWPGPGADIGVYQRPEWQREQIMKDMNMGYEG